MPPIPKIFRFADKKSLPRLHLYGALPDRSLVPFDFTQALENLCQDIAERCPELAHIDTKKILFTLTRARVRTKHGLQAKVIPLRFENGQLRGKLRGRWYYPQRYIVGGQEIFYHVSFCVPRFIDSSFEQKLITVIHELYHISPEMNGDIRRLSEHGRYAIHSKSQKAFNAKMAEFAVQYLRTRPDPSILKFLYHSWRDFELQYGGIIGNLLAVPKLIPAKLMEENPKKRS
jgi:hypothetical protein